MIVGSNLHRVYGKGSVEVRALDGVDISIRKGEFVGITGASGSGHSSAQTGSGTSSRIMPLSPN